MIDEGFRQVQEMNCEDEDESSRDMKDQTLPKISQGMEFKQVQVDIREGKTTPPPRFTEATLLSAMENPVKYMENILLRNCFTPFCWKRKEMRFILHLRPNSFWS